VLNRTRIVIVGRLIAEARRRILGNELFAQGANASSAALCALILLLLLGTEILSWPVVIFVPIAALAIGMYRVRRRLPSHYRVAQIVDQRLGLADTLSTAVYFRDLPENAGASKIRRSQLEYAERTARTVDARSAIPFVMPRSVYVMGALVLVASSLFALRYGLSRHLDLKQPLANFIPESLSPNKRTQQASERRRNLKQIPQTPDESGENADPDQRSQEQQDPNQQMQNEGESPSEAPPNSNAKAPGKKQLEQPDSQMATDDQQEGNDDSGKNSSDQQDGQQGDSKKSQPPNQQQGNKQDSGESGENSSLMDKMKDAFQNLLSKVKPQPQNQQNGQQQQDQKGQQGKSQQGSKSQNSKDGQQQSAGQQGDAQEGENGEQAKNDENTQQQKGQGKSDSQQASKQPGSGVGSQDGEKAIKNAEQLAAMGKLTEILGKRSQTVTGEATVEVQSTNQQLRTGYINKGAQHTQGGAEINRDEVPIALQPYVQQYLEQVRKQAAPAAKKE
jgi:hypothetical protein